jgi:hypothetical protein
MLYFEQILRQIIYVSMWLFMLCIVLAKFVAYALNFQCIFRGHALSA